MKFHSCITTCLITYLMLSVCPAFALASEDPTLWTELSDKERQARQLSKIPRTTFSRLAKELSPAIVNIWTKKRLPHPTGARSSEDPYGRFFGYPSTPRYAEAQGSGFIIHASGYVVTNAHVVEDALEIRVRLQDGAEFEATLVGSDPRTDLALVQVQSDEQLVVAPLGNSDGLEIGEWVLAIGNPFGLDHTVTAGIVSAKGRKEMPQGAVPTYANFIQTDASVNPGNSGGPLINMLGEVVGINAGVHGAGQGIGFAIPINMAKQLIPQLAVGKVERSWLGIRVQDVTRDIADVLGLKEAKGALISHVDQGSPADLAGLKVKDVVLEFDGQEITEWRDLLWLAASGGVGNAVPLTIHRRGKTTVVEVVLGKLPEEPGAEKRARPADAIDVEGTGMSLAAVPEALRKSRNLPKGVGAMIATIEKRGGARTAGLRVGDIVWRIGDTLVRGPAQFAELYQPIPWGKSAFVQVFRSGHLLWVTLRKK